eukprot:3240208-Pyramimonas_sp.AAC.1
MGRALLRQLLDGVHLHLLASLGQATPLQVLQAPLEVDLEGHVLPDRPIPHRTGVVLSTSPPLPFQKRSMKTT